MGVIINDFEVVVEQPESATDGVGGLNNGQSLPQIKPQDIQEIMRHYAERKLRVQAH